MTAPRCQSPLPLADLVGYQLAELDGGEAERIEEHFFACAECARRLEWVSRLGAGIAELVRGGRISSSVTADLLERASDHGLRLRSYRLGPGDAVACTAAPADDFVVMRFALELEEAESVDLLVQGVDLERGETWTQQVEDVPVDRACGEVVYVYAGDMIRSLPRTRWELRARVRGPRGERTVGIYTLDHTPWEQLSEQD